VLDPLFFLQQIYATIEYASNAPEPLSYPRLAKHLRLPYHTPDYLRLICTSKVSEILKETPLILATNLSSKLGNQIWLKREDLQLQDPRRLQ
jgi:threonine dehydratase